MSSLPNTSQAIATQTRVPLLRRKLLKWGRNNIREFRWRSGELSPYEVAVAEMLLKRTTATAAARVFPEFLDAFPDIEALSKAGTGSIAEVLRPIGLYNQRAISFKQMALFVCDKEGQRFPRSLERLRRVPGLGEYSARAVLCFSYGVRTAIVDSNVDRIVRRLFSVSRPEMTAREVQQIADTLVPSGRSRQFNWAMLDFSAAVCRYDRPRCERCPLIDHCEYGASHSDIPGAT